MKSETRFNMVKKQFITLTDGEKFCKKCDGKGAVPIRNRTNPKFLTVKYLKCSECFGDGKIDWIEQATGKSNGGI